jgi:hypothetical protein
MASEETSTGQPGDQPRQGAQDWIKAGSWLDDEDEHVLHLWRDSLTLLDPRYKSKVVLKFAALAMSDPDFRTRLVHDTENVLREFRSNVDWPEGVSLRFVENTADTLHVVLPPRAGQTSYLPPPLREALRSRTDSAFSLGNDDWDIGNTDSTDWDGDPDSADDPNWPPHPIKL